MSEAEELIAIAYVLGRLTIYPRQRLVMVDGVVVEVSPRLFKFLLFLARNTNRLLTHDDIAMGAWGKKSVSDSFVSTYINQARRLLGAEAIVTEFAKGYIVTAPCRVLTGPEAEPPTGTASARPIVKLPPRPRRLIGRERELAELEGLLRDHLLVSLVGSSGAGKTVLATELCWRMIPKLQKFHDGVVMVDLAPVTDPAAVASALAQALGLPLHEATDRPLDAIAAALRDLQMLLTFDNCEHLAREIVELIKLLQARAPKLTVLATTQHVLDGLDQEVYWLRGLAVPAPGTKNIADYGAVKLLLDGARSGDQNFAYADEMADDVTAICARVDGNPLSLLMAAARVHFYTVKELRKELDEHFGMLYRMEGTADQRHLSQQDMTEWSYGFLDSVAQQFFCRLGIFPSWFSAEEAVALAAADGDDPKQARDRLLTLVNKSMVIKEEGKVPPYRLLTPLRFFAHEHLVARGERKALALRHAQHVLEVFLRDEMVWETLPDRRLRQIYAPQINNLRLALETMLAEPALIPNGITLLGLSGRLWSILRLIPEGQGLFDRYMPFIGEDTPPADKARFLRFAAILCRHADRRRTVTLLEQSAALYRKLEDWLSLGAVLAMLGGEYLYLGRYDESKATLAEALKYLSGSNHLKSLQEVMNNSGNLAWTTNDLTESARCLGKARTFAREMGDPLRENIVLLNLGELELRRGAIEAAIDYARQAVGGLRAAGEVSYLAWALTNLATYLTLRGDHDEARRHALDGVELLIQEGGHGRLVRLQLLGVLAVFAGEHAWGANLIGHATGEYARTGVVRRPTEQQSVDQALALLAARYTPAEIEDWLADGAQWPVERAVALIQSRIVPLLTPPAGPDDAVEPPGTEPAVRGKRPRSGV